ncbi:hypothetical protein AGMMS50239_06370 [Bacteroidia bacterium]|nr:hypothetical protein AGMMS50239_06370 [Bacteroidia bacterium]
MEVKLREKFSSNDFGEYISKYYEQALNDNNVHFDLEKLEWISLEGITFLFAWINKIKNETNCSVKITLPNPGFMIARGESDTDFYRAKQKRRCRRLKSLLKTWQLNDACNISVDDYINPPSSLNQRLNEWEKSYYYSDNNWNRIIPFRKFDTSKYESINNVRTQFSEELNDIFSFEEDVNSLLDEYFINTPFANKTISHLITTELFLNTLHHAKQNDKTSKNECYFSISAVNQYKDKNVKKWLYEKKIQNYMSSNNCNYYEAKQFIGEIEDIDIPFWQIKSELKRKITENLPENIRSERSSIVWDFFKDNNGNFRNISYIEFAFIDFGPGIPTTLKDSYEKNINKQSVISRLSDTHFRCNSLDSKILEYAFLLETSENPFDENIQIQEFVPRGLYFLLDIVRLYRGLLVVRSKKGEAAFDFSKTINIKESVRLSESNYSFPGTMINIILPEQSSSKVLMEPVQEHKPITSMQVQSRHESVLDIYNSFQIEYCKNEPYKPHELYIYLFKKLNNILDEELSKEQPSIIYFDFAGTHLSFMDYKIFYFLANTPKINKYNNLILLNINDTNLLDGAIEMIKNSEPFIFRPIPCVIEEKDGIKIKWIGVRNDKDEDNLNKLLQYPIEYSLAASDFNDDVDSLKGNVIEIKWVDTKKTAANVQRTSFLPVLSKITHINSKLLNDKLRKRILYPKENEEDIILKKEDTVYLSSGGYYLYQYVNFFDILSGKDAKNRAFSENIAINLFNLWRVKTGSIPQKIDWILTVTLSSQMLGRDVRKVYKRLMLHDGNEKNPRMLKLTNYNEFSNELGFDEIKQGDTILVVNDVISTGNLNKNIYDSVKKKNAKIIGFFSIVDCRVTDNYEEPDIEERKKAEEWKKYEVKCVYDKNVDDISISLVDNLHIRKYKINIKNAEKIVRINPMTNAPTTMGFRHSENKIKIIYEISEVFKLDKIKKEHFLIGYFRNNNSYHTYFPNTENIFLQYSGKEFMRDLIEKVIEIEKNRKNFESEDEGDTVSDEGLKVDYVFYPVFSGIEAFDDYHFQNYFQNKDLLSYPMPRIDTPKGWRFTFPSKILNENVKWKVVFILDDGSCSGETILQMIDSICFYEVKKIIVLSVFGRLEDFQREFYSRIKKLKVKKLKGKNEENSNDIKEPIVDAHIYFGIHLNIHHFPYEKSTPFVDERKQLKTYLNEKTGIPQLAKKYIKKRINELEIIDVKNVDKTTKLGYYHFPKIKNIETEKEVDIEKIFEIRNNLGKLDSYRIYEDYYKEVDYQNNDDLELIIGIINHEPRILDTIKNLVPELYQRLRELIYQIVFGEELNLSNRDYVWDIQSLMVFLFTMNYSILYDDVKLDKLFNLIEGLENEKDKQETLCYLSFLLWKECIEEEKNNRNIKPVIFKIWHSYYEQNKTNTKFYNLLCGITDSIGYKEVSSVSNAFHNLHLFYWKSGAKPGHKDLEMLINDVIPILRSSSVDKIDTAPLENVIKNIRTQLKRYIDKICDNVDIEQIYKFKEDQDSIYNLINSIISEYRKVKDSHDVDGGYIASKNSLADLFDIFKSKFIETKESFAQMCLKFNENPIEIWKKVIQNNSDITGYNNVDFNVESLSTLNSIAFPIHTDALEVVFYNILQNTCKVATDTTIKITYNSDKTNGLQIFSISQTIDFQKELREGKGIELIEQIVKSFGGQVVLPEPNSGNQMFYHIIFPEIIK